MTDTERAIKSLLRASKKYQDRFSEAVKNRETNMLRLSIKLEKGRVTGVKINTDEDVSVEEESKTE